MLDCNDYILKDYTKWWWGCGGTGPHTGLMTMQHGTTTLKNTSAVSLQVKHMSPGQKYSKRYVHLYVHDSTVHNSQDMETTLISINRWMDKDVVHIYNGILLSHKKEGKMPFAATWMQLEIIILSEVSQNEKDKYHMILLICGI